MDVVAVEHHDLRPDADEFADESLLPVAARVGVGDRPQLRVRAEYQVIPGGPPASLAGRLNPTSEGHRGLVVLRPDEVGVGQIHEEVGRQGIGLCSFTVGLPPEELTKSLELYRKGLSECVEPVGKFKNETAATFTMVHCAPTKEEAYSVAKESFEWYPKAGARLIASVAEWMEEMKMELGTYEYAAGTLQHDREGALDHLTFDYLHDSGSAVVGDPEECITTLKRYEAAGCDLMLCLVNPYDIPHEQVMQSIELMGKEVIPAFR